MSTVAVPTGASTQVIAEIADNVKGHAVWFQNFSTTVAFNVIPVGTAAATELMIPPAVDATHPGTLIIQSSGGDTTLVNKAWKAFQSSGGNVNLNCGRW